jgi:DNA-damage-inducible protein J
MNATVKARVETDLKVQSEAIFKQMGLDMSSAIKMFLSQVVMREALPFEVKIIQPNARTLEAIADSYAGKVENVDSIDGMFEDAKD